MPLATLKVQINEASAKYDRLPYGIDNFTADFYGELDLMRRQPSFADLKIFHFQGAHTDILADALVEDLLGDPRITLNTKSTIDMTALAQTFPLQEGVRIEGKMDADIRLKCKLSSIKNKDLGRIKIGGKLNMEGLALRDSVRDFEFTGDASLGFFGNESLGAKGEIRQLKLHYGEIDAALEGDPVSGDVDGRRRFDGHADASVQRFLAVEGMEDAGMRIPTSARSISAHPCTSIS